MSGLYGLFGRAAMFVLDGEQAHNASIKALKAGLHPRFDAGFDKRLAMEIAGLKFPNPLGMAAGFDKNGEVPNALHAMGFGHAEIGTVTPQPQPGNAKPRVFRLLKDRAVINRLGFNSQGHDLVIQRVAKRQSADILGINIGANKTSADFAADYVAGVKAFAPHADYLTANISSPNTPGLRGLQEHGPLDDLLNRICQSRDDSGHPVPVFLKIAPDLDTEQMEAIADSLKESRIDGLIVSNTTLSRSGLKSVHRKESGGLSGEPLFERATIVLARMRQLLGESFPIIGVGGVTDAQTALAKIEAGADLVQLYTGMIYNGPGIARDILQGLSKKLDESETSHISMLRGTRTDAWASRKLPD